MKGVSKMPFVSVVIPICNSVRFLPRLFHSLSRQQFKDFELLFIDDGSHDGSAVLCSRFLETSNLLGCVLNTKRGGPGSARNVGIDHSKGDFVTFVDSDDMILPNHFGSLAAKAQRGVDIVESLYVAVSEDGSMTSRSDVASHLSAERIESILLGKISAVSWGKYYRREMLNTHQVRFPEGIYNGEDHIFGLEAYTHCKEFECTLEYTYIWCRRTNSLTTRSIDAKFASDFLFVTSAKLNKIRLAAFRTQLLNRIDKQFNEILASLQKTQSSSVTWFASSYEQIISTKN